MIFFTHSLPRPDLIEDKRLSQFFITPTLYLKNENKAPTIPSATISFANINIQNVKLNDFSIYNLKNNKITQQIILTSNDIKSTFIRQNGYEYDLLFTDILLNSNKSYIYQFQIDLNYGGNNGGQYTYKTNMMNLEQVVQIYPIASNMYPITVQIYTSGEQIKQLSFNFRMNRVLQQPDAFDIVKLKIKQHEPIPTDDNYLNITSPIDQEILYNILKQL